MMNVLALGLVLTSLVTAGFFTPNPEKQIQNPKQEDVIVKEGHRVVVVEYEKDDGNTKVLIQPQDSHPTHEKGFVANAKDKLSEKFEDAKDKISEKTEVSEKTEDSKEKIQETEETLHKFSPKELVCDAYGKCKDKIATAIGKTKEGTQTASDKAHEAKEQAKDTTSEVLSKGKDKITEKIEDAKETASDKAQKAEETIENVSDKVKEGAKKGEKELSEILRQAREVSGEIFGYAVSPERLAPVTGVIHLMGFAAAYGICVWVTFASSYVLAGALPRQQFAMVQSRIYPVYFKAMGYGVGTALLGHLMGGRGRSLSPVMSVGVFQGFNLMAALGMILVNLFYLEPRATKVMVERMKKEKEEGNSTSTEPSRKTVDSDSTAEVVGRGTTGATISTTTTTTTHGATQGKLGEVAAKSQINRLSENLEKLNSYSSFLNVLTLGSLTLHLVYLGQRLHNVC